MDGTSSSRNRYEARRYPSCGRPALPVLAMVMPGRRRVGREDDTAPGASVAGARHGSPGLAWTKVIEPAECASGGSRSKCLWYSPSVPRGASAISRTVSKIGWAAAVWPANSSSEAGRQSISSGLPATPGHPRSRIWPTIAAGLEPQSAKSPPWRIRAGAIRRKSARTASNAVRLP